MPRSRTRKILSLGLVTASLGAGGLSLASPGKPLLASNGRPACGNTLSKAGSDGRRAMLTTDMAKLTRLVKAHADATKLAERDALIASIRDGLEQLEACDTPAPVENPTTPATAKR